MCGRVGEFTQGGDGVLQSRTRRQRTVAVVRTFPEGVILLVHIAGEVEDSGGKFLCGNGLTVDGFDWCRCLGIPVEAVRVSEDHNGFIALFGPEGDRIVIHYFLTGDQICLVLANVKLGARRNIRTKIAHALRNIQRVDFPIRIRIHMLPVQTCAAVQLGRAVAVHIHQFCHGKSGQQSAEAVICTRGSLAVLVLQGGDLIQIRLSTLRRQGTEVSRACSADSHCAGQYSAEHCLSDFVHRDSPSFYQASVPFLHCTAAACLRQLYPERNFYQLAKYFTI